MFKVRVKSVNLINLLRNATIGLGISEVAKYRDGSFTANVPVMQKETIENFVIDITKEELESFIEKLQELIKE